LNITLLDGRVIDADAIVFDPSDYSFSVWYADGNGKENITTLIRRADKLRFYGFDGDFYNNLLYVQKYQLAHNGATPRELGYSNVWAQFAWQLANEPLKAPLAALDKAVDDLVNSSGITTILVIGGVALVLIILAKR